jgi:hypothetical protein
MSCAGLKAISCRRRNRADPAEITDGSICVRGDVISMPDKWEYPWFAAWDLAFHCIAFSLIDVDFAKQQLELLLYETYLHPNGQIPAYEWAFGDVNPPVHAMAALQVFRSERQQRGRGDLNFLQRIFHKLLMNYTWWINNKDSDGLNVFEGGFMGLDNISVFDRSTRLPCFRKRTGRAVIIAGQSFDVAGHRQATV